MLLLSTSLHHHGRNKNINLRFREYLAEDEVEELIKVAKT